MLPYYWQAELVLGVWLQGPGVLDLVSDCRLGVWGSGSGHIWVQGLCVLKVVLAYQLPGLGPSCSEAGPRVGSGLLAAD